MAEARRHNQQQPVNIGYLEASSMSRASRPM